MACKQLSANACPDHFGPLEPMTLRACSVARDAAASTAPTIGSMTPFTPNAKSSRASASEPLAVLDEVATDSRSSIALATPSRNTAGGENASSPASAFGASESFLYLAPCCATASANDVFALSHKSLTVFVIVASRSSNSPSRLR